MQTIHDNDGVRAHYAALAAHYDAGANRACITAYEGLARRVLEGCGPVLELGAGARPVSTVVAGCLPVCVDLSREMLAAGQALGRVPRGLVADGQGLPFRAGAFGGAVSINVLEHVPDPAAFVAETARILRPGGVVLMVTPNGDLEWLLDLLEALRLKLPEGPHAFRTRAAVAALFSTHFEIVEHRAFLAFPAGPPALVRALDLVAGGGLFQYLVGVRR